MKHVNPRLLIPVVLLGALGGGGWYLDGQHARQRSVLSGFFESRPTEMASRVGGRVAMLVVRDGDAIPAGRPLIFLEATPTQDETAAKQAAAEQARQQFREARNGPRPQEIARQRAAVAEAVANLARLRHGPRPEEVGAARARVNQAEAAYRKTVAGARPQEIAEARAAERAAWARLQQAERGPTPEERAQARARLDAALAGEALARKDAERMEALFRQDAVSGQQRDRAVAGLAEAGAKRQEMEEAWRRAEAGTPAEEREQVREAYREAQVALVRAGARPEDVAGAGAARDEARQNLQLVLSGTRLEDLRAAQARLDQAEAVLDELRAGSRREQVAALRAAAQAAQAQARASRRVLAECVVRAPFDGVVERTLVSVGDLVSPGTPVARLTDPRDVWVRVYVPESALARVGVGSDAVLRVDGVPDSVGALVESVASRGEFTPANLQTPDERGRQVFGVRLRLTRPDARVKAGMYATVDRIGAWRP